MAAKKTAKKSPAPAPAKASAPVAKKAAKKAVKKAAPAKTASKAAKTMPKITTDMIARAAYLIYRRRIEQGLPGDSQGDWIEAERQLTK